VPRTRIRGDQEQGISFVSEDELNQFFGKTVITGTVDSTVVLEDFDTFFPGRGLIIQQGQIIVTTGTNFVSISGGDASGEDIDDLQVQIDAISIEQAGVGSITASGVTLSGAIIVEGLGTVSLSVDGQTITFSGSGSDFSGSAITDINGETGPSITLQGAGEVSVSSTATNEITISGTPHTENTDTISDAIIGAGGIVVTSGVDTTTISGGADFGYIKDDDDIVYAPDDSRGGKLLSVGRDSELWGNTGNQKLTFLGFNGIKNTGVGWLMPRDATITNITTEHDFGDMLLDIVVDGNIGTPLISFTTLSAGPNELGPQDADLAEGETLQVYLSNTSNVRDPIVWIELAWRLA
jgi:hypothetical protein